MIDSKLLEWIKTKAERCGGNPTVGDSRITVWLIFTSLMIGEKPVELLNRYTFEPEDILACFVFAHSLLLKSKGNISLDLDDYDLEWSNADERHLELMKRIILINDAYGSKPVIRNTGVSVEDVLAWLAEGNKFENIINYYSQLEPEDISACFAFSHFLVEGELELKKK